MRPLPELPSVRRFIPLILVAVLAACACAPAHRRAGTSDPARTRAPVPGESVAAAVTAPVEESSPAPRDESDDAAMEALEWALRDLAEQRDGNEMSEDAWEVFGPIAERVEDPEPVEPAPRDDLEVETPEISEAVAEEERHLVETAPPTFDLPIEVNDQVLAWVDVYSRRNRDRFRPGLVRSGRYVPMIRRIFEEEGLPQDLAYMAHVESAYKPHAYSRAHAKGVFQFIASTGRRYGLRIDYWVDERSDPEKATRAAAAYLKDLYAMFGDWYLALAGYNAGEGKIQRALRRSGRKDFWGIARTRYIRRETKNYVPAILAATLISKEPAKYGFEFEPDPPVTYDTIPVTGAADLRVIARCAGTEFETIKTLNPALRRAQTPPRGTTEVRVPVGSGASTIAALAQIPESDRVVEIRHRVRRGDTLWELARTHRVSVTAIQQSNGMGHRTRIVPGQILKIPRHGDGHWVDTGEPIVYRVRRGDTLSSIARRHGTTPGAIARASGVSVHGILRVGQRLTVPTRGVAAVSSGPRVHTVRRGDTLWRIASRYRVSLQSLCAVNRIAATDILHPGTKLTIPTK